ncbi:MAG TPA: carbon storage regulator [Gemmataceae bacterium]|jgi:carbon storage regulator|nr:carbon storage regulator [Gemmataceae bacterium]
MLVLSRKPGEQVLVPQCALTVTVLSVEGNTVRLGISAPAEVGVYREEVWRRLGGRPDRGEAIHDR